MFGYFLGMTLSQRSIFQVEETRAGQEVQAQPLHSQTHIETTCSLVSDLRAECPPIDDRSLAELYRKIVARHMQLEEFI